VRGNVLANILRKVADAIEKMDDLELERFASNLTRDEALVGRVNTKSPIKNKHSKIDAFELEKVLGELSQMSTRAAGAELLDGLELSRKELEALAKLRKIHVMKDDNVARIKEKIVEVVIGARLNSRAIRGEQA
jgi:hypothetical protein